MTIEYLSVDEASARVDLAWPDVYFSPGYGAAVEETDGGRWEVAVGGGGRILAPSLLRAIPEPLAGGEALFDSVSPYGYSGTWAAEDVSAEELAAFRADLRRSRAARGVVAEFQRLGGPLGGCDRVVASDPAAEAIRHLDTIAVPLDGSYDTYWSGAKGRHRTSTRKARKLGLTWQEAPASLEDLTGGRFRALYDGTMQRVAAKPYYFFADRYYTLLHAALGDDLRLAQVRNEDGVVVAAALFMRWGDLLHYHLAGSERDAARMGANNLLLDGMIAWAFEQGVKMLHLGGGITAGDPLYRFKAQFGGRLLPYWLLRTVLDEERYDVLTARRAAATKREPRELLESGFFPAYRA